jgi:hypothetical protein
VANNRICHAGEGGTAWPLVLLLSDSSLSSFQAKIDSGIASGWNQDGKEGLTLTLHIEDGYQGPREECSATTSWVREVPAMGVDLVTRAKEDAGDRRCVTMPNYSKASWPRALPRERSTTAMPETY